MSPAHDPSLDAPTVVGHKPTGLFQPRPSNALNQATTPLMPPPGGAQAFAPPPPLPPLRPAGAPQRPAFEPPAPASSTEMTSPLARDARGRDAQPQRAGQLQLAAQPAEPADAIVAAASPLLALVAQLRDAVEFADVGTLRNEVVAQMQKFEENAVAFGAVAGDVTAARYILCSLIDEAVMTTPWGSASAWSTSSLLNRFHNETWGGEKVFAILDRVRADPKKNLALLRLIDLVLLLGFEGMHRVLDNGRERLADLRDEVGALVAQHSKPVPSELSENWRGVSAERSLRTFLPLWMVFSVVGVLLICLYGYQRYRLTVNLAPVVEQLRVLGATAASDGASR